MSSHFNEKPDLEVVARACHYIVSVTATKCGLSERQFRRCIILVYGMPPSVWSGGLQMRDAVVLIMKGKCSKEVAFQLNFKRASDFCRAFKRQYHMTPHAYFQLHTCNSKEMSGLASTKSGLAYQLGFL